MKTRLLEKGYDENNIILVIEQLKESGYLDDNRFTRKWIRDRLKHKIRGRNLIKKELLSKGIELNIIEKEINSLIDDDSEIRNGIILARKWLSNKAPDLLKLKRYLYNKGFSVENIQEILEKMKAE
jgi:regulatory protein